MPVLQIDNCPADLYAELAADAAQEQHTVAEQALIALREYPARRYDERERRRRLNDTLAWIHAQPVSKAAQSVSADEIKAWINEGRA